MKLEKKRQVTTRMSRMDGAEVRFRARQELAKRQDGLLSRLCFDFAKPARQTSSTQKRGNFFFGPGDVNSRLELLRQRLPDQVQSIRQQADKILEHRFDLLGYSNLAYGSPIDWHLDLVHTKQAPRKMFYNVGYLNFEEVGDSKIIWELNRHQHLVTLAKAHRLTGDLRYVDEILRQWSSWRAENPYPIGINWASSLEAAFRSLAWLWTYHLLEDAPGVRDFREDWLPVLFLHGRHIERYLSTYFSPNTHLLGEGVALFFLGVLCPELSAAARWKTRGWQIVLDEARRQVLSDGFHFEQSTYYHVYALDLFLHAAVLASVNGFFLETEFTQSMEKMLDALYLLGRCGEPPRFGDDDGGRLFDSRRNRGEHLLDPLATGAVLFHRGEYKAVASLTEETIWLFGREGVETWDELVVEPAKVNSAALQASGLYFLCSQNPATQLVMDCGPMGTKSGGHGHADALSVTLRSREHDLLTDPGACEYIGQSGDRDLFRGTAMHNTLRVDGMDQAEAVSAFSWRQLSQSKVETWIQGKHFDLLIASHDGYHRLATPLTHRRWVLSLKNGMYLVRDHVEGAGRHQLEISWHLGQRLEMMNKGIFRMEGTSQGLVLMPVEGNGWVEEISQQSWSPVYGQKKMATVVTFSKKADVPNDFITLIAARDEVHVGPGTFIRVGENQPNSPVSAFRFAGPEGEHHFYFAKDGRAWQVGPFSSDAEFVCWSRLQSTTAVILVGGSYAEVEGGPKLGFTRKVSWGELIVTDHQREIFSSDPEAVRDGQDVSFAVGSGFAKSS
jgi:hypothetical protein